MFSIISITLNIRNNRNYPQRINVLGSPVNPLDTANAITEYRWDITAFTPTASDTLILEYKPVGALAFSTYTATLSNPNPDALVAALNGLGIGYFNYYTELGQNYLSTNNDDYVYGNLTISSNIPTTTTTTTTAAPTTSTTTTTTTEPPTTTTTTSTTTTEPPTTTTTTSTTTTEPPTTTTTTSTTTTEPPTTTTTTSTTTTEPPTTTTTTSTTTTEPPTTTTTTSTTTTEPPTTTTTTSTTTTEPPTTTSTTTTTTTSLATAFAGTTGTFPDSTTACANKTCGRAYYRPTSLPIFVNGVVVYDDATLTTPFNGGNNWVAIDTSFTFCSGTGWTAIQIDTNGVIIGVVSCPSSSTTTTTTEPPTTTTTTSTTTTEPPTTTTTSTTTTEPPTTTTSTTTTTTTVFSYAYFFDDSSNPNVFIACSNYSNNITLYAASSNPATITRFYTDAGLVNQYAGNNNYYVWSEDNFSTYVGTVDGNGDVNSIQSCP